MKGRYAVYESITKEILNSIKKGDSVKCNDWKKPMKVVGVSPNYFVMTQKAFGETIYSVCEKIPCGHIRNNYNTGYYRIGTDDYIGGCGFNGKWEDEEAVMKYLEEFESGKIELSVRRAVNLTKIQIKSVQ